MAKQIVFRSQFQPAYLKGGSQRVNHRDGSKHYVANFIQNSVIVHLSKKEFRTSTEAIQYSNNVLARYKTIHEAAEIQFLLGLDVNKLAASDFSDHSDQLDQDFLNVLNNADNEITDGVG